MKRYCVYCKETFLDGRDVEFQKHLPHCKQKTTDERAEQRKRKDKENEDQKALMSELSTSGLSIEDIIAAKKFNTQKVADKKAKAKAEIDKKVVTK